MKTYPLVFTILLTGGMSATTHATAPVEEVRQQVVSYADLDLEKEAEAATLFRRIKSAARTVCTAPSQGLMPLAFMRGAQVCAQQATAQAVADVDAPLLTRHANRGATPRKDSRAIVLARGETDEVAVRK